MALYRLGRVADAKSALQKARDDPLHTSTVAMIHIASGDTAQARELLTHYEEGAHLFAAGLVHGGLGNHEECLEYLRDFFRADRLFHGGQTIRIRYLFPHLLAPLRDDPRYERLIRDLNQAWGLNPDGSLPDGVDVAWSGRA